MARTTSPKVATTGASIRAEPGRSTVLCLLISVRPGQWTKNLLVFAGLLFGLQVFNPAAVADVISCVFYSISPDTPICGSPTDRSSAVWRCGCRVWR